MSPQVKQTVIIAGVATLTVVGVLLVVNLAGRAVTPGASVHRAGVLSVTGAGR
jgi:hypothetical protein